MPRRSAVVPSRVPSVSDQPRRSGRTPAAIAVEAGVAPSVLCRFLSGERGLNSDSIDRLAAALGLRLVAIGRPRARPRSEPPPGMATVESVVAGVTLAAVSQSVNSGEALRILRLRKSGANHVDALVDEVPRSSSRRECFWRRATSRIIIGQPGTVRQSPGLWRCASEPEWLPL